MKRLLGSALAVLLSVLLLGCNSGSDSDADADAPEDATPIFEKKGFGEAELQNPVHNPEGAFLPAGSTAILFLEAPGAEPNAGDTGTVGMDEVWIRLTRRGYLGMLMENEDLAIISRVELWNQQGGLLMAVDHDTRFADVTIPAGDYGLRFFAGHNEPTPLPLFLSFDEEAPLTQGAVQARGQIHSDTVFGNVQLLLSTNSCPNCDLSGADLRWANLSTANLSGADMRWADLSDANLIAANLSGANLRRADLKSAALSGADLRRTHLLFSNLREANLSGATLSEADLSGAYLFSANLWGADLSGVNLSGADMEGAIWVDGTLCGPGSFGQCVPR